MNRKLLKCSLLALLTCSVLPTQPVWASNPTQEGQAQVEALQVSEEPVTRAEAMLHTAVQIQIYHQGDQVDAALDEAFTYMADMEKLLTTQLKESDVYQINQAAGKEPVHVAPETYEIIERAIEIAQESDGLFDISIGALTNLWQIGSENARVPEAAEIQDALERIDYRKIQLNPEEQTVFLEEAGMALELGGISKGYIGSGVAQILKNHGITTAIINLGGNVVVLGSNPNHADGWNVGVQDPDLNRGAIVGTQRAEESAIVTSGIYERYLEQDGKRYHHIMDPRTGYPLENEVSSVTVFAPTSFEGDAYSTALFLIGIEEGIQLIDQKDGYEVVYIDHDHKVYLSKGLQDTFELTNEDYELAD
ncbi:thiamine biosynthesis protein ApbE [Suicoccus acidiformans]|uniref:FAD:protein FMN transferase n=1 Tax=Suicoccus acidiformans TaxID=2036206 RepID=A0A347WHS7_9LACT|nr:FAD:protein FMN transferase [Suicoccus acidiformans]AXY24634.1 thiamine biosynthesis protein ApbE [Suicoccus acidiformans]